MPLHPRHLLATSLLSSHGQAPPTGCSIARRSPRCSTSLTPIIVTCPVMLAAAPRVFCSSSSPCRLQHPALLAHALAMQHSHQQVQHSHRWLQLPAPWLQLLSRTTPCRSFSQCVSSISKLQLLSSMVVAYRQG